MKRFDIRVAIGSAEGPRSGVWHFWSRKGQVYVVHSEMGPVQKFSFHTPDYCALAFTKEHGTPSTMRQRAMHKWRRDPTPEAGTKRAVRVLRVGFATDLLPTALPQPHKQVVWVQPAPPCGSTVLDLMFVRDAECTWREALASDAAANHRIIAYKALPSGEAWCLTSWFAEGSDRSFRIPASHGTQNDIIISPLDPAGTGRPIRVTAFSHPKDGDLMRAWEFGAYAHRPLTDANGSC